MTALSAASCRPVLFISAAGLSLFWLQAWASTRGFIAQASVAWLCIEVAFQAWQSWRYVSVYVKACSSDPCEARLYPILLFKKCTCRQEACNRK